MEPVMPPIPALQTNNGTYVGRYWTEHSVLRRYVPSDKELKILSFGCSTGEELLTLQLLFPNAHLYGCDNDWSNLARARAVLKDNAVVFHSNDEEILRHGPFDIIICNSVLLRPTRLVEKIKTAIDPTEWSSVVATLDQALKPGGILQIINSNIPFRLHRAASGYEALRSPLILGPNYTDQFDLNGKHLCSAVPGTGFSAILNRHLGEAEWRLMRPTDLEDVHFRKSGGDTRVVPVENEAIPNMNAAGTVASGSTTYRPEISEDRRPSTHTEIDVHWTAFKNGDVRLHRSARRVWFDGSIASSTKIEIDMTGPVAGVFIESAIGRRSTRISMDLLLGARASQTHLL